MYLVDTNVLSASAPTRLPPPTGLIDWMDRQSDLLYLSVITIAEVADGIAKARRQGASRKAADLESWLGTILHLYGARILPVDSAVALILGAVSDRAREAGHAPGLADLAIAATAIAHGCTVLTRHVRHFRPLGLAAHDPFAQLPPDPQTG
jgi:predicted nucleic acid-binding protein